MSSPGRSSPARSSPSSPDLLPAIDRAAFATSLGLRLRAAGVDVGLTGVENFARALEVSPPADRASLYWAARVTLARRSADLPAFDAVFDAVFGDAAPAQGPAGRGRTRRAGDLAPSPTEPRPMPDLAVPGAEGAVLPWVRLAPLARARHDEPAPGLPERLPSRLAAIADVPFPELDADDLALLETWLSEAMRSWPRRPSRRMADHSSGSRISLRRTLTHARRTGFEPVHLHRERPVTRPRRLVMLCDVSQSMQPYAAAYLHLMRAAAVVTRSEVLAFSTTLTRLTVVLAHKSPEVAIELAGERVRDRFGGTRIASNLRSLLASHHGESVRGAIVIIASDGWDADEPDDLALVMARLRRRAHRVIWLNPRAAAPGYEPLVGAMAAALPYCDALLPAQTVRELAGLLAEDVMPVRRVRFASGAAPPSRS